MNRPADITALLLGSPAPALVPLPPSGGGGAGVGAGVPAFVAWPSVTPHSVLEGCNCPNCAAGRTAGFLGLQTPRQHARGKLAARSWRRDTGLSNTAYLAATTGTQKITVKITPARVKFTISDPLSGVGIYLDGVRGVESNSMPAPGRRGVVRKFSDGARDRLADRAAELEALGKVPQIMATLTSPANWEEIYLHDQDGVSLEGGRIFKGHMEAFRKRLERKMQKMGVHHWAALWFLEFQERGAPHVHLIVFDCVIDAKKRKSLRSWAGRAWAGIVGNPSKIEKQKHINAGTQIAKMKKPHFGYAKKYASKMHQKDVPDGFHGVGRFWGVWNCRKAAPIVLDVDYSRLNSEDAAWVRRLVSQVLVTVHSYSPDFVASRLNKVENAVRDGIKRKFGFTVFGAPATESVLALLA